jgi:peptidoglycan/LPS O-acetylase OafA/YrhL
MVFLFHTRDEFYFGFLGVDFFFVLSSFLLTYLAFIEIERTDNFSKSNFFARRALRIFPLYFLVLMFSFWVLPVLTTNLNINISLPKEEYLFWLFLSNYDTEQYLLPLKFLWSIAVEEQFYLLFLLLSLFFRRYFLLVTFGLIGLYSLYMFTAEDLGLMNMKSLPAHFANFAFGMGAGYLYYKNRYSLKWSLMAFIISVLLLYFIRDAFFFNLILSLFFTSLIFTTIIFARFFKELSVFEVTEYLGKYTYGLYIYSGFIIVIANNLLGYKQTKYTIFLELICVIILAFISYHAYEKHFLKLKKRFRKVQKLRAKTSSN